MIRLAIPLLLAMALSAADELRFTKDNELIRPEEYRHWVFVGSSYAMSYREEGPAQKNFHNTYIAPQSWEHFRKTGKFPEKTVLLLETYASGSQESINREGSFEDRFLGLSAAVKDSSRFKEGWAYFSFGENRKTAKAFPKEDCWACHNKHAALDNVFVQFYPVLRRAR